MRANLRTDPTAGKTCMVDTALQYKAGVASVCMAAGTTEEKILADPFKAIRAPI
jgi:hypothetical protein